jgi:GH15 family glucan-1,4-alpha-glucosidase
VRLGNAAYGQIQLDLYGAILDAAYLYNKHGAPLDYDLWQNLRRILDWLCDNWHSRTRASGRSAAAGATSSHPR